MGTIVGNLPDQCPAASGIPLPVPAGLYIGTDSLKRRLGRWKRHKSAAAPPCRTASGGGASAAGQRFRGRRMARRPEYGGGMLQFFEKGHTVFAEFLCVVHRVLPYVHPDPKWHLLLTSDLFAAKKRILDSLIPVNSYFRGKEGRKGGDSSPPGENRLKNGGIEGGPSVKPQILCLIPVEDLQKIHIHFLNFMV